MKPATLCQWHIRASSTNMCNGLPGVHLVPVVGWEDIWRHLSLAACMKNISSGIVNVTCRCSFHCHIGDQCPLITTTPISTTQVHFTVHTAETSQSVAAVQQLTLSRPIECTITCQRVLTCHPSPLACVHAASAVQERWGRLNPQGRPRTTRESIGAPIPQE